MNIVIIEDEHNAALELQRQFAELSMDIKVLAVLDSVEQSLKWFSEHEMPNLIFADIQLGDGLSFEIFRKTDSQVPIVFCTTFDQYAMEAFKANGIDYLLKPIEKTALKRCLIKVIHFKNQLQLTWNELSGTLDKLRLSNGQFKTVLLVPFRDQLVPVATEDIVLIKVDGGQLLLLTKNSKWHILDKTMEEIAGILNPLNFFRANRQYIIGYKFIQSIGHQFNRKLNIQLFVGELEEIQISREKSSEFLRWMEDR